MNRKYLPAVLGVTAAIAITTTMDATGYAVFSALPLLPLGILLWALQKFSRREMGLIWGRLRDHGAALGYPLIVLGAIGVIAWLAYPLYGFGEKVGALGIEQTHLFGPEVGWLGIALNLAAALALWFLLARQRAAG